MEWRTFLWIWKIEIGGILKNILRIIIRIFLFVNALMLAICFEGMLIRMGILIFIYSSIFLIIFKEWKE